jgi:glycosyltransferase involved in cell wall biosynthesis
VKVLVLSNLYPPEFLGGYELACSQAADALRGRGHVVEVLTSRPRQLVPETPHVHRVFHVTDEWSPDLLGDDPVLSRTRLAASRVVDAYNVHALTEALGAIGPDVVYVHNLVGLGGLGLIGCLQYLGVPWVWHLGDTIPRELCSTRDGINPELAAQFGRTVRGTYSVVSRRVFDACHDDGLALNGRVELLPYWITGERPLVRARCYQGGDLRIMAAGRLDRQKGIDILIEAVALVRQSGYGGVSTDLFGNLTDPSLPALIRDLGLSDHVRLMGPRPQAELLRLYNDYDLFAFPTRRQEPFGLVPLEAASRGCVPLLTDDCGIAEWLAHGVHCLKAARTPGAFAQAIQTVLSGEVALEPIARRAGEAAWRDFHLDRLLPRIESLLADAARGTRSGGRRATRAEAYWLARMAEQITQSLIEESLSA